MKDFIKITNKKGKTVLINPKHIIEMREKDEGLLLSHFQKPDITL